MLERGIVLIVCVSDNTVFGSILPNKSIPPRERKLIQKIQKNLLNMVICYARRNFNSTILYIIYVK